MAVRQPRYNKEEFARRGDEIYESQVRSQVEEGNHGKLVVVPQVDYCKANAPLPPTTLMIELRHPDSISLSFSNAITSSRY
jgi:hypothetical protein